MTHPVLTITRTDVGTDKPGPGRSGCPASGTAPPRGPQRFVELPTELLHA